LKPNKARGKTKDKHKIQSNSLSPGLVLMRTFRVLDSALSPPRRLKREELPRAMQKRRAASPKPR